MRTVVAVLLIVCAGAVGEDRPAMMTRLMVKLDSPEIPNDSFAAQAKRMYRAGSGYCRIEENLSAVSGVTQRSRIAVMNECGSPGRFRYSGLKEAVLELRGYGV